MIEVSLSMTETKWYLARMGIEELSPDSPLADALALIDTPPAGSPAEGELARRLESRKLVPSAESLNPFLETALEVLAKPERVWCLSLFGPHGADMVHLAFGEEDAVECKRESRGVTLRFPIPAGDAKNWLKGRLQGGDHDR